MTLPYKPLITAGLVAGLLAAAWGWHAWDKSRAEKVAYAAGAAEVRGQWQAAHIQAQTVALEAEQAARTEEQRRTRAAQEAMNAHRKQAQRDRAAADAARSELDRLRDALAARDAASGGAAGADPGAGCRVDAGATERELFQHCAQTLAGLAAEADGLAGRLSGLQAWVRGVCVSPVTAP